MKCLVEECKQEAASALKRGLCMRCYSHAKQAVDTRQTTWEYLERNGLALSLQASSPFGDALTKKQKADGT